MRMNRSMPQLILVVAAAAAVLLCVGGQEVSVSSSFTRPSLPDHGRWSHDITATESTTNDRTNPTAAVTAEDHRRRFRHTMVIDSNGNDLTTSYTIPTSFTDATTFADTELVGRGISLLKYDIELSHLGRILDEDQNIIQIQCQPPTQPVDDKSRSVALTVNDVSAALNRYPIGVIIQGSHMWSCVNERGQLTTILIEVQSVTHDVNVHTIRLDGMLATYQQLFGEADVLLRQPSLTAAAAGGAIDGGSHRRLLSSRAELETDLQTIGRGGSDSFRDAAYMHVLNNQLTFSSPAAGDYSATDSITVSFTGYTSLQDPSKTTVHLYQINTGSDSQVGSTITGLSCVTPRDADSCSFSLSLSAYGVVPRFQGYYVQIKYCTNTVLGLCVNYDTSNSATFWIPESTSGAFATADLQTFQRNCTDIESVCSHAITTSGSVNLLTLVEQRLCSLCENGRDMSFHVTCQDCNIGYEVQVSMFSLKYSIDPLNLYVRSEIEVDGRVDGNLDLTAGLTFEQKLAGKFNIIQDLVIPPSISIPLGVITLTLGAWFDLDSSYSFDVNARAEAHLIANIKNVLTSHAVYDSRQSPSAVLTGSVPPFTFTQSPTIQIEATGEATLAIALIPRLNLGLHHLISTYVQTDVTVQLRGNFSFPAFPSIASGVYDFNPSDPAFFHYSPHGNCSTPHLVRYDISAGLLNSVVGASLDFDIGSSISSLLSQYDVVKDLGTYPLPTLFYPLVSGCLLKQQSSQPFIITFNLPATTGLNFSVSVQLPTLSYNLVQDLALALNVSSSRFLVELIDAAGNYLDDLGNIKQAIDLVHAFTSATQQQQVASVPRGSRSIQFGAVGTAGGSATTAQVVILDSDDPNAMSSLEIQTQIKSQMADPNSQLRSSGVVTSSATVPTDSTDAGSSSHTTAIVVGVVVSVVGLAIILLLAYYFMIYRKKSPSTSSTIVNNNQSPTPIKPDSVRIKIDATGPQPLQPNPLPRSLPTPQVTPIPPPVTIRTQDIELQLPSSAISSPPVPPVSPRRPAPPPPPTSTTPTATKFIPPSLPVSSTTPSKQPPPIPSPSTNSTSSSPPPLPSTAPIGRIDMKKLQRQFSNPSTDGNYS